MTQRSADANTSSSHCAIPMNVEAISTVQVGMNKNLVFMNKISS